MHIEAGNVHWTSTGMRTTAVPGLAIVGVFEVFVLMPVIHGLTLV